MKTGTVRLLKSQSGYGFLAVDGTGESVFFHASALDYGVFNDLTVGQKVSFEIEESPKGTRAENVELLH